MLRITAAAQRVAVRIGRDNQVGTAGGSWRMAFYVATDPILATPGVIDIWATAFPTRAAAESALRAAPVSAGYVIVEAPTRMAAVTQLLALTGCWSR